MVQKHFVTFFSPGTFVHEQTTKEILGWNVKKAVEMARNIKERYGATPFGFQFSIRGREDDELDSDVLERSCMYYLGGKIETREEVEARNLDNERILRDNMRINEIDRVIVNTNSYKITLPFNLDDVLLEFEP